MNILVINSGSSSVKFKLVDVGESGRCKIGYEGQIEDIGTAARIRTREGGKSVAIVACRAATHAEAFQFVLDRLQEFSRPRGPALKIDAVGHRVVHGGAQFRDPVRIDAGVLEAIRELSELAPLHNPGCIQGIEGALAAVGSAVPMVAVFDTGFHRSLPPKAATYGIEHEVAQKHGLRRYGFHGIAHASLATIGATAIGRPIAQLRLITLQLGNGCSATAIDCGRSVDTSMGFTPLEGLVMGTRSGDLDPALVGHLVRHGGLTVDEVDRLLSERSGLLGLSGLSRDMRTVLEAAEDNPDSRAALAVEVFCYRVRKYIGAYLAVLGGADAIIFGGGIGERAPEIRARICAGMDWCGLRLDPVRNKQVVAPDLGIAVKISEDESLLACYVAGVDEEREIARATAECLRTRTDQQEGRS